MIELNKKTQQDFLNREWVQKLLNAGVNMSDAKYIICSLRYGKLLGGENIQVELKENLEALEKYPVKHLPALEYNWVLPTYTVSELLYKLHEYIYPTIDGKQFSGGLKFCKDAPFYIFYYALKTKDYDPQLQQGEYNENYIYAEFEYPIESLACLLIQCHKRDIGIKDKNGNQVSDVGDISDK